MKEVTVTDREPVATHILGTSANLVGFTFLVLVSIKGLGFAERGLTDEVDGVCVVLFTFATLMSFLSLRSPTGKRAAAFERAADLVFLVGLVLCLLLALSLVFGVINLSQ